MDLGWVVGLAGMTVAWREREAAERARCYRGEFFIGPRTPSPVVLGVFGDSVGCGFGATSLENTFAGVVAEELAKSKGVLCRIAAVNGARARTLREQDVRGDERFAAVSIGTNDALHGEPIDEVERELGAFLRRLSRAERVVVVGPGAIAEVALLPEALRPFMRRRLKAYEDALVRAVAPFSNAVHVGFSSLDVPLTRAHFAADGFHPGDLGQRLIGELVCRRLVPARGRSWFRSLLA
jgi:lysophospholipase L1-like esterase